MHIVVDLIAWATSSIVVLCSVKYIFPVKILIINIIFVLYLKNGFICLYTLKKTRRKFGKVECFSFHSSENPTKLTRKNYRSNLEISYILHARINQQKKEEKQTNLP